MELHFNKPYLTGKEINYIMQAVNEKKISGDGIYTKKCQSFFEDKYGFLKCLLTTSCTDALEMAAILINIGPGDEVIMPSYTFVSTANAFVLRGAKVVFVDSNVNHPGINEDHIEELVTTKTKAIVPVHYAGVSCNMDKIMTIAQKHNLYVIEDAAQAIDAYYTGADGIKKPLGSIGHLSAFSFHETKNIMCGEGGMLVINDEKFVKRAEIIRDKGTNRSSFFRGEVDKYGWVDMGSSFLPSDIIAAFLYAQLEHLLDIQHKRLTNWNTYYQLLFPLAEKRQIRLPYLTNDSSNNAHMFYILCKNLIERTELIAHLKEYRINAVFHYLSLHKSSYYELKHDGRELPLSDFYSDTLLRLPMYYELSAKEIKKITTSIYEFYQHTK